MAHSKDIFLVDYTPPDFLVDHTMLDVDIRPDHARVSSKLKIRCNPKSKKKKAPLVLQGETQKLLSVTLNGRKLSMKDYRLTPHDLTIPNMPDKGILEIVSTHNPYKNTALSGLYASGPMLCTQCEAEGFRRITYYPDRPDVMAKFCVTIHADKKKYPVLLSNGNLVKSGSERQGRHWATWEDPHPKPCYLFAMVAGKLDKVTDRFTTKSGRKVRIEIYVEPGRTKETGFALTALKKSMKWDEKIFGLEYDLDRFMIVATPFFNMGAMENKGLNIFNDSCVLGLPETATDGTISFIERVVGHEYFHNWTGDRITCRDWFQLSLKEGLTVFREQEFCGDMNSIAVERLDNVRDLRRRQYAEDAGAMAHPVRPDHYQAIDNFYTATVYDKGSEVVRMIQTLAGRAGFVKGMKLYVKRHDGQAVTCDDFVKAMADANRIDLRQFMLWYQQAGTPVLKVASQYDVRAKTLRLKVEQSCPPTPGQKTKKPMHIPLAIGLLDAKGRDLIGTKILSVKKPREEFTFKNIKARPILSLLRNFSAPVRLVYPYTDGELLFLLAHDSDSFCRWEAGNKLLIKYLLAMANKKPVSARSMDRLVAALGDVLRDKKLDAAFKAMALSLPSEGELGLALSADGKPINPDALYTARKQAILLIARKLQKDFKKTHEQLKGLNAFATDGVSMGKRSLKNLCLAYLAADENKTVLQQVFKQATTAKNMTDQTAALGILVDTNSPLRTKALAVFEKRWKTSPTIMDKWLSVQASAKRTDVLKNVQKLMSHRAFSMKNPNRISALIGVFSGNIVGFHAGDGSGYRFIADMIMKIDPINPHSAAALTKQFARWKDYEPKRQKLMLAQLKRLAGQKKLSANVREIVEKSLKA
ncbi:MAG: aminopeptidase N [Alphaproteobacteria bacterium]|nr:aminopeptidase N [Alphaproteobacteria bacterium]